MNGLFLREGEHVEYVDPDSGLSRMDQLEDERQFDTADLEARITAPESNRKIVDEIRSYTADHERRYGRFPKTLMFAANDLPHTSHADQLVHLARDAFGRGNWTFFGSDEGGKTAAVLMSFIASCKRCRVEPFAWFRDVLSRIATYPVHRLAELLPHNWKPLHSAIQI
jgi:IS66 C-terminal element